MKRILLLVALAVLSFLCIFNIGQLATRLFESFCEMENAFARPIVIFWIEELFFPTILLIFCVVWFLYLVKQTNTKYEIKYTYEQYKEMRQKKKAEKQKAKLEKLQKQLNEIEKDTK